MFDNIRALRIGGMTKAELMALLSQRGVKLNDNARALFADPAFTTSVEVLDLQIVEISLPEIGLPEGGRF